MHGNSNKNFKAFCNKSTSSQGDRTLHTLLLAQILFATSFRHMQQRNGLCQQVDNVFRGTHLHSVLKSQEAGKSDK